MPLWPSAGQGALWLGHGQCIEQYGTGEAYLPLLAALGQMGRSPDGPHLVALLRQHAPSWLLQLPALLSPQDAEALQRYAGGTTRERMLRGAGRGDGSAHRGPARCPGAGGLTLG